ncbi:MAG: nucleotidyl transferase AbiEii/AbiGii toxin family protein [Rikenellaceae bacterium]
MVKNIAKSVRAKLLNISKQEGQVYQTVITRYIYERLLYRLSISDYRDKFCLKGGTLLYAMEREYARPTLDVDFLGIKIKNDEINIKNIFTEICSIECAEDGVLFDYDEITTTQIAEDAKYTGVRVSVTAHFDTIKQLMKMDIGFGDIIIPKAIDITYPCFIDQMPSVNLLAYSLESVVAEKFNAMIERADNNSRFKDFYDVYKILIANRVEKSILSEAINSTFQNRNTEYKESHVLFSEEFTNDETRQLQWRKFLVKIKAKEKLEFNDVVALITQELKPIYEKLK